MCIPNLIKSILNIHDLTQKVNSQATLIEGLTLRLSKTEQVHMGYIADLAKQLEDATSQIDDVDKASITTKDMEEYVESSVDIAIKSCLEDATITINI